MYELFVMELCSVQFSPAMFFECTSMVTSRRYARDLFGDEGDGAPARSRKRSESHHTPDAVVRSLVSWAVRTSLDRLLDPASGDGRFLAAHANSVGVEQDPLGCQTAHERAPGSLIHQGDFFAWAGRTQERFDCAVGNPPFTRFQQLPGAAREAALRLCARHGAVFTGLSSSWAPVLVAAASLLKPGGRMAFVVPAESGHASCASPVLEYLVRKFDLVQVIAVRKKLAAELSEDSWLLYAEGFGGKTASIRFTALEEFDFHSRPPGAGLDVSLSRWREWHSRLRPFLLPEAGLQFYRRVAADVRTQCLGELTRVSSGYITGANDFFHLRPSDAARLGIPQEFLHPAVRIGKSLADGAIDAAKVLSWLQADEPVLLLRLHADQSLPASVQHYLDSDAGQTARKTYKCRIRKPWYVVPEVTVPDGFLSYASGQGLNLVSNPAGCVCTNAVHAVHLNRGTTMARLDELWKQPLTALSCEIEGHPHGGMLRIEPREASRILLSDVPIEGKEEQQILANAVEEMKRWRHRQEPSLEGSPRASHALGSSKYVYPSNPVS
jgi:hypothetical protein